MSEENDFWFVAPDVNVLLVDDDEISLNIVCRLLQKTELKIDTATDGRKALEMIRNKQYDIVLMDHMMPVMNGIEAVRMIRGMKGAYYQSVPIIAMTGNAGDQYRGVFYDVGMNDIVAKPVMIEDLCKKIKKWLPKEKYILSVQTKEEPEMLENKVFSDGYPQIEGIDVRQGIENWGDEKLYFGLLEDFYKIIEMKSLKMESCLNEHRIKDFTIEVHALRNTTKMVGANELSEKFRILEELGNRENEYEIRDMLPTVLCAFRGYKKILASYVERKQVNKKDVDYSAIISLLHDILVSVDTFDMDGADAAMQQLETYVIPENCQNEMEQLRAYMADVAMEDIMNMCGILLDKLANEVQK